MGLRAEVVDLVGLGRAVFLFVLVEGRKKKKKKKKKVVNFLSFSVSVAAARHRATRNPEIARKNNQNSQKVLSPSLLLLFSSHLSSWQSEPKSMRSA